MIDVSLVISRKMILLLSLMIAAVFFRSNDTSVSIVSSLLIL